MSGRGNSSASERIRLPEGVSHGSVRAVRLGCCCKACMDRRKRAARRGTRFR